MPMPKALLCSLGEYDALHEEARLRETGFATALVAWKELSADKNAWMQLSEVLNDDSVMAWVLAGEPEDFTADVLLKMTLLALSLDRERQPATALVQCREGGKPYVPPLMEHVSCWHSLDPFAAKLMAARFREGVTLSLPFHLRARPDPLIGLWFEAGPAKGGIQEGFILGVLEAEVIAFGEGPRGTIPGKCTMAYPMLGIKGDMYERPFSACAAQNRLDDANACHCKVEGLPTGVFLGPYPEGEDAPDVTPVVFW